MNKPLIRFARRLANWEETLPVDELQRREFKAKHGGPDLRPSVYEINADQAEVVRVYAEHAHTIDPPGTALGVDAGGRNRPVATTPGNPKFSFIRNSHRELVLRDDADLLRLVGELAADPKSRQHRVAKKEVLDYVRERLDQRDSEWADAAAAADAKPWLVKLRKP